MTASARPLNIVPVDVEAYATEVLRRNSDPQAVALARAWFQLRAKAKKIERPRSFGPTVLATPVRAILRATADEFLVTIDDILGSSRSQNVASARTVAYWLLRTQLGRSFPEIGRCMKRDHTTVMHAVRRVAAHVEIGTALGLAAERVRAVVA